MTASSPVLTADLCLKCNICTAACPVAAVTDLFPGPKAVGPQAERFRHPHLPPPDASVTWCSGCGTCTRVCPHGVAIAEINIQAKARLAETHAPPLRDHVISRPEWLGFAGSLAAPIANPILGLRPARWALEKVLGIDRHAPMPPFARRTLRARLRSRCVSEPPADTTHVVAYYHGCSTNYYEPELGQTAIAVLERLGCRVILPPQRCCGLPLQSNGFFPAARRQAGTNIRLLLPFVEAGIPIVGTSTSCTLALKHDYRTILGIEGDSAEAVAHGTFDIFEFLDGRLSDALDRAELAPIEASALYHPPCQLKSHFMGTPAARVLRRIPGLRLILSQSECCGIAGTYGLKHEKFEVARAVGEGLFEQTLQSGAEFVLSDSETCRWWMAQHARRAVIHPIELLAKSLRLA
jgi:glycerol-3-phosphate dehydrogenase subunit C